MIGFTPGTWIQGNVIAPLLEIAKGEMEQLRKDAIDKLEQKFDELEPKIIGAAVTAIGHGMGDLIPGKADDKRIEGVIGNVLDLLGIPRP